MFSHSRPQLVVLRLRAGGPANGRVREVHVRRHGTGVCWATGVGIGEVVRRAGRRDACMRRRSPTQTCHMRTSTDAVRSVVVVGRRLQRLGWSIARRV